MIYFMPLLKRWPAVSILFSHNKHVWDIYDIRYGISLSLWSLDSSALNKLRKTCLSGSSSYLDSAPWNGMWFGNLRLRNYHVLRFFLSQALTSRHSAQPLQRCHLWSLRLRGTKGTTSSTLPLLVTRASAGWWRRDHFPANRTNHQSSSLTDCRYWAAWTLHKPD